MKDMSIHAGLSIIANRLDVNGLSVDSPFNTKAFQNFNETVNKVSLLFYLATHIYTEE